MSNGNLRNDLIEDHCQNGFKALQDNTRPEPKWFKLSHTGIFLLIAICASELFLVQRHTLNPPNWSTWKFNYVAPSIRLLMNFCFFGMIFSLFYIRGLVFVFAVSLVAYLGLVTYFEYFRRPLSLLILSTQWSEGWAVFNYALTLVPLGATAILTVALIAKLSLLVLSRDSLLLRRRSLTTATACLLGYAILFGAGAVFDPLSGILRTQGIARKGVIRGYLGAWLAEWLYLNNSALLQKAISESQVSSDLLSPREAAITITGRIVVLQLESLGYDLIGHEINNVAVTPFLNRLRDCSMYYRVRALRRNGSADADFVMLSGKMRASNVLNYALLDFPYADAWPHKLQKYGYESIAVMGADGQFYSRRQAFEKMGFSRVYFAEELTEQFPVQRDYLGVRDSDVFTITSLLMRQLPEKSFFFTATVTTHGPFDMLRSNEQEIFPNPQNTAENYFNSFRYLDNSLRAYLTGLPAGSTVVIYGDHTAGVNNGQYRADIDASGEYVPFFIYQPDQNLANVQKTRNQSISKDGSLSLLDLATYLRRQVRNSNSPSAGDD